MRLRYKGQGTIVVEGVGIVAPGETVVFPPAMGAKILEEQPEQWERADDPRPRAKKQGGD